MDLSRRLPQRRIPIRPLEHPSLRRGGEVRKDGSRVSERNETQPRPSQPANSAVPAGALCFVEDDVRRPAPRNRPAQASSPRLLRGGNLSAYRGKHCLICLAPALTPFHSDLTARSA